MWHYDLSFKYFKYLEEHTKMPAKNTNNVLEDEITYCQKLVGLTYSRRR